MILWNVVAYSVGMALAAIVMTDAKWWDENGKPRDLSQIYDDAAKGLSDLLNDGRGGQSDAGFVWLAVNLLFWPVWMPCVLFLKTYQHVQREGSLKLYLLGQVRAVKARVRKARAVRAKRNSVVYNPNSKVGF